jgi:hypothetical protein
MDDTARELVVDLSRALEAHNKPRAAELARLLDLALEGERGHELASLRLLARSFSIFMRTSSRPPPPPRASSSSTRDPFAEFGDAPAARGFVVHRQAHELERERIAALRGPMHRGRVWAVRLVIATAHGRIVEHALVTADDQNDAIEAATIHAAAAGDDREVIEATARNVA